MQSETKTRLATQKRMVSIWWGVKGVIYWKLLPKKATISVMRYRQKLNKLEAEVINIGLFIGKIYFQKDNAKPNVIKERITKTGWAFLPYPPHLPGLSPSDYHRSLSNGLIEKKFENEDELKRYLQDF